MQNPFESGHIKNYILLYVSVVVIMILFFIATTLFHDVKDVEQKVFSTEVNGTKQEDKRELNKEQESLKDKFKLMQKSY
ncbi:MAG: hypothetical protein PHQ93_08800 [Sulfurimonas sp.]|uniref:hypothetical protein n=1 Tax=Sulfurimonas sp. TaxID=2022749 RepID=UPI0026272B10|nr:hypothetical protein [Sulfurimonas sp.]MDD5401269.1 hypothetical protein [Sulfurimonas sp.]